MKALIVITGRGLGGDSVIAYNIIEGLEAKGVQCEIALDESAPGLLFKKKGRTWHKIKIPQAGGHAATKASSVKAAFKMLTATFKARSLIKKLDVDIVVGVIGGGAIVGSVGAKLAGKPGVSIISTPLDSKICPKLNQCYALPEMKYFLPEHLPKNINHTLYPLSEGVGNGNPDIALEKLKESPKFDENKKILPIEKDGIELISTEFFTNPGQPVIWRGGMLNSMISHFFYDVKWHDDTQYIIVDFPPGTGDITLDIKSIIPQAKMILVTTPHPSASHVAIKAGHAAKTLGHEILGVVENMSYYINPIDGSHETIFGKDGGIQVAKDLETELIAQIPIGQPLYHQDLFEITEPQGKVFDEIVDFIIFRCENNV